MSTMNIALPTPLKDFVLSRVEQDGYSSASEYMRELIRSDQKRRARELLEQEILKGAASPAREMTRDDWKRLHARIGKNAGSKP